MQSGCAEVPFERPVAAFSSLIKLSVLGQPALAGTERDLAAMISGSLSRRGLTLDAASGLKGAGSRENTQACVYLRGIAERQKSLPELCSLGDKLLRCRCGACSDCLKVAGCLDKYNAV